MDVYINATVTVTVHNWLLQIRVNIFRNLYVSTAYNQSYNGEINITLQIVIQMQVTVYCIVNKFS